MGDEHIATGGTLPADSPLDAGAALERLQPHSHLSLFYDQVEEWRAAIVPFIRSGLDRGHKCIYVGEENPPERIRAFLRSAYPEADACEASGQLAILPASDAYLAGGTFDPEAMIGFLERETDKAVAQGYPLVRYLGETGWVMRDRRRYPWLLIEYEARLNEVFFPYYPVLAVCLYNRALFEPGIIKGIMMTHPMIIWHNRLHSNPFYVAADLVLACRGGATRMRSAFDGIKIERDELDRARILAEILAAQPGRSTD